MYFIFFHLFRNEQAVGSSPTISSKTCVNTAFSQVFFFFRNEFQNSIRNKKSHSVKKSEIFLLPMNLNNQTVRVIFNSLVLLNYLLRCYRFIAYQLI